MEGPTNQNNAGIPPSPMGEGAAPEGTSPEIPGEGVSPDARSKRVQDYLESSLKKCDPLEANLGSVNSTLMGLFFWLGGAIEQATQSAPPSVGQRPQISSAMDTLPRFARQIDRSSQLEVRLVEARKPPATDGNPAMPRLDAPTDSASDDTAE